MLETRITLFTITERPMLEAVQQLASLAGVQCGIETLPLPKGTLEPVLISLTTRNRSVRQLLNQIVRRDRRYIWRETSGFINVLPRVVARDRTYTLNRVVPSFAAVQKTSSEMVSLVLDTPPLQGERITHFSFITETEERRYTVVTRNVAVRELLNSLAQAMGDYYWAFAGVAELRVLSFLRAGKELRRQAAMRAIPAPHG